MRAKDENRPEEQFPPAFWSPADGADLTVLAAMHKGRRFDRALVFAVAARCGFGYPQVTVCAPVSPDGSPFPTLFWLSCPHLVKKCGELESNQLIAELEKIFASMPEQIAALHERYAVLRRRVLLQTCRGDGFDQTKVLELLQNSGVGGINWRASAAAVKCLHLQTAAWLGLGWHPASAWLSEKLGCLECGDRYCAEFMNITKPH